MKRHLAKLLLTATVASFLGMESSTCLPEAKAATTQTNNIGFQWIGCASNAISGDGRTLYADGTTFSSVYFEIVDGHGNPIPHASVTITSSNPQVIEVTTPKVVTDSQGYAYAMIRAGTKVGKAVITVHSGNTSKSLTLQTIRCNPVKKSVPLSYIQYGPRGVLYGVGTDGIYAYGKNRNWTLVKGSASFSSIQSIQFSRDGVLFVEAGGIDGGFSGTWKYDGHKWEQIHAGDSVFCYGASLSSHGDLAVLGVAGEDDIHVWEYKKGKWFRLPGNVSDAAGTFWSPQGILTLSTAQGVEQYINGRWIKIGGTNSPISNDLITDVTWSPSGTLTVCAQDQDGETVWQYNHGQWDKLGSSSALYLANVNNVWFTHGGAYAYSGSFAYVYRNGDWSVINPQTKDQRWIFATACTVSPDGVLVAAFPGNQSGTYSKIEQYKNGRWVGI
jgi:hypothetical protein